jgi:hypothetical protein
MGGVMLILVGIAEVTSLWGSFVVLLLVHVPLIHQLCSRGFS